MKDHFYYQEDKYCRLGYGDYKTNIVKTILIYPDIEGFQSFFEKLRYFIICCIGIKEAVLIQKEWLYKLTLITWKPKQKLKGEYNDQEKIFKLSDKKTLSYYNDLVDQKLLTPKQIEIGLYYYLLYDLLPVYEQIAVKQDYQNQIYLKIFDFSLLITSKEQLYYMLKLFLILLIYQNSMSSIIRISIRNIRGICIILSDLAQLDKHVEFKTEFPNKGLYKLLIRLAKFIGLIGDKYYKIRFQFVKLVRMLTINFLDIIVWPILVIIFGLKLATSYLIVKKLIQYLINLVWSYKKVEVALRINNLILYPIKEAIYILSIISLYPILQTAYLGCLSLLIIEILKYQIWSSETFLEIRNKYYSWSSKIQIEKEKK